jgi:hypothetical protein
MAEPGAASDKPRYRELEQRRNRDTFYGESEQRQEEVSAVKEKVDPAAIYLAERAAIRLRRLRWAQSVEEAEASVRIDRLALEKAGKWETEPTPPAWPLSETLLAQYARPDERASKEQTVRDRVAGWFTRR